MRIKQRKEKESKLPPLRDVGLRRRFGRGTRVSAAMDTVEASIAECKLLVKLTSEVHKLPPFVGSRRRTCFAAAETYIPRRMQDLSDSHRTKFCSDQPRDAQFGGSSGARRWSLAAPARSARDPLTSQYRFQQLPKRCITLNRSQLHRTRSFTQLARLCNVQRKVSSSRARNGSCAARTRAPLHFDTAILTLGLQCVPAALQIDRKRL